MGFIHQIMLYFSTAVSLLYLISGGYKAVRNFWNKKIDEAAARKSAGGAVNGYCHNNRHSASERHHCPQQKKQKTLRYTEGARGER
ncbi:Protein of uncharacterised function (DUF1378) [Escherichia coli]|nr:Protein of uncharacterised function (DUF1378) [Escherichia coli]